MPKQLPTLALLLLITPAVISAQVTQRELPPDETTWRTTMRPGASLQIIGGLGDITVVKSEGDEILLEITRGNEGAVVPRVVVAEHEKGVSICGDWSTRAGIPSPCARTPKMLIKSGMKDYASLDMRVAVPDGVNVAIRSSTGDITVGPLTTSVTAETYRGDIRVSSTGPKVRAESQDGSVALELVPELIKQSISISTIRGNVRVVIPESRLVKLDLYPRGARVRSAYDLDNGGVKRGDAFEYKGLRTFSATLGPPKERTWTSLEIFALDDINSSIEIAKP